jgi:uncharacterized membrane protein YqjE
LADRSSSNLPPSGTSAGGAAGAAGADRATEGPPPGLGEQFGRTRGALIGLIRSHINLAKAEFSEIADEIKRAAALGGIALLLLFLTGMLLVVGLLLFLGEAVFGSIGWGLLNGVELLLGVAVLLILAIIDLSPARAFTAFVVALGVGLVVTGLLAVDWNGFAQRNPGTPAAIVLAVVAGLVIVGALGFLLASSFGRGAAIAAVVGGAFIGALLGWLASFGPGLRVGSAIGVAALLLFWPIVAAVLVFRHGVDTAKLRKRFVPDQTIATTKETIEWVREQMPLGPKS